MIPSEIITNPTNATTGATSMPVPGATLTGGGQGGGFGATLLDVLNSAAAAAAQVGLARYTAKNTPAGSTSATTADSPGTASAIPGQSAAPAIPVWFVPAMLGGLFLVFLGVVIKSQSRR